MFFYNYVRTAVSSIYPIRNCFKYHIKENSSEIKIRIDLFINPHLKTWAF